jgi:uncharacterized lipoprotein YmbA
MIVIAMGISSCASPETHYYSLAQDSTSSQNDRVKQVPAQALWIEVAPVHVPERLNRQNIVLTNRDGTLKRLEHDKWSAPLPEEMRDLLSQELQQRLGAVDNYQLGVSGVAPVYSITAQVVRMNAELDKRASADLCWTVRRKSDSKVVTGCTQVELYAVGGVGAIVDAYRMIVTLAAADIANGFRSMGGGS